MNQQQFIQMLFWPVKVGERVVSGTTRSVYAGWLAERIGASHYRGETTATTSGVLNGANGWLADNGWPERLVGAWSRDFDVSMLFTLLPPALNWIGYTQATWGVNGILKDSIGAPSGSDMPAIVIYQTGNSGLSVNGIRIGNAHYALAKKFTLVEYWGWSENYVDINWPTYVGDLSYWNGSYRVFLSDYYDMTFGAFRLRR